MVLPVRRTGSTTSLLGLAPCGGVAKQKANTLTNLGAKINSIWETTNPIANGNCTISISPALDRNFTALKPSKSNHASDFSFPCGRQTGFEYEMLDLPDKYACDSCTLQFKWSTPKGEIYSCSDIMVIGNKMENCMAKCLNRGACLNGKCVCQKDFYGEFCEDNGKYKDYK